MPYFIMTFCKDSQEGKEKEIVELSSLIFQSYILEFSPIRMINQVDDFKMFMS